MAKTSVSEWSDVAGNNLDIEGINLSENMPPSYVNNAMREMMAQIKQWKDGYTDPESGLKVYQSLTVENISVKNNISIENITSIKGTIWLNEDAGVIGQAMTTQGNGAPPIWTDMFTTGMVMIWYGSINTVPTGWAVCDGTNGTPNLKNKFVIGAGGTYGVNIPGGYADAQLPTHTHAGSTNSAGAHAHSTLNGYTGEYGNGAVAPGVTGPLFTSTMDKTSTEGAHTHTVTVNAAGASATNKNLPPFLALFYIMKI